MESSDGTIQQVSGGRISPSILKKVEELYGHLTVNSRKKNQDLRTLKEENENLQWLVKTLTTQLTEQTKVIKGLQDNILRLTRAMEEAKNNETERPTKKRREEETNNTNAKSKQERMDTEMPRGVNNSHEMTSQITEETNESNKEAEKELCEDKKKKL